MGDRPASSRRSTLIGLGVAGVALLILFLAHAVFFTVLAGVLFSIVLRAPSEWLHRRFGWSTPLSLAVVTIGLVSVTLVAMWALGSRLGSQLESLFEQLPQSIKSVQDSVRGIPWMQSILRLGVQPAPPEVSSKVVAGATSVLSGTLEVAISLVAVFFIGVYGAAQPQAYSKGILRLVPIDRRPRAREVLADVNRNLSRWLVGRLLAMASVAIITAVGLKLAGIPLSISLGFLAGLFTFVEYLGAVASAVPAILVAMAQRPSDALWVILVFTIAHVVEGYLLTPFITRGTVRFAPAFTLAMQVLFGSIFGVVGLTFATPVVVIAAVVVEKLYIEDFLGDTKN
jgi:predicted PurR-regulated permease PerM